jgi:hypothetical protein
MNTTRAKPTITIITNGPYLVEGGPPLANQHIRDHLHIVTLDRALCEGSQKVQELPNAYDPTIDKDASHRVFA